MIAVVANPMCERSGGLGFSVDEKDLSRSAPVTQFPKPPFKIVGVGMRGKTVQNLHPREEFVIAIVFFSSSTVCLR